MDAEKRKQAFKPAHTQSILGDGALLKLFPERIVDLMVLFKHPAVKRRAERLAGALQRAALGPAVIEQGVIRVE